MLNQQRSSLRGLHNQMVTAIARLPVGPEPSVYDDWATQADCLEDRALYMRNLLKAMKPVIERISDDAFNIGGAKPELFDLIGDAFTDFIWPLESAAEDLRADR